MKLFVLFNLNIIQDISYNWIISLKQQKIEKIFI